jgi:DNA-binding NtrC family response regulator
MSVNVRVICATNKLLEQRVAEGLFREDLFYRINVVTIHVPPLRERRDEVPQLARYFLEKFAAEYHRPMRYFGPEVEQQMLAYRWPGNVRELENLCKRFVIVGNETQILRELSQPRALPAVTEQPAASAISAEASMPLAMPGPAMVKRDGKRPAAKGQTGAIGAGPSLLEIGRRAAWNAEQEAIHAMLVQTHWNRREAAVRLRVSYKALLNKLQRMKKEEVDGKKGQREKTTE